MSTRRPMQLSSDAVCIDQCLNFFFFHTLSVSVRPANTQTRLRQYTGLSDDLLVACAMSTTVSWAGLIVFFSVFLWEPTQLLV